VRRDKKELGLRKLKENKTYRNETPFGDETMNVCLQQRKERVSGRIKMD